MATSSIIKDLRALRVLVMHPRDSHAEELLQQVTRIGCRAEAIWPLPQSVPDCADVVFVEVNETPSRGLRHLFDGGATSRPTLIGIAGYENPSVLQNLLELRVDAVVTKPLRAYGVLSSMVMARRIWHEFRCVEKTISKLKSKVENTQKISQAKFILMRLHKISEEEAYRTIRSQAMSKRTTTAEIAQAIINADGILGNISSKGEEVEAPLGRLDIRSAKS
ncbi:AmiR/NasT family two-component response regulator [Natronocella acetinitrilica]|uniref:AmiR/NasT family two-component response regulator n=1 Tax=Natronocella acetinitrilica TaxID=414046 RepID=A0AAE3G844_9GAMM|nr:ANTAR domain-containing protein [Natronocella acetinitrilica]MCP1676769.1 AmiR/NasT family two-component response regulator [Natronocella acetinitrilica]